MFSFRLLLLTAFHFIFFSSIFFFWFDGFEENAIKTNGKIPKPTIVKKNAHYNVRIAYIHTHAHNIQKTNPLLNYAISRMRANQFDFILSPTHSLSRSLSFHSITIYSYSFIHWVLLLSSRFKIEWLGKLYMHQ